MKKILFIMFSLLLLLLTPKNIKNYNYSLEYVSNDVSLAPIYLLDNNNYVSKTNIEVKSNDINNKIKELIDTLIKDGPKENEIPNGFKSIINEDTKLLDCNLNNGLLKLNFSKSLLIDNEMKVIESLVYTMTELEQINNIMIYIEGNLLTKLSNGDIIYNPLNRNIGINKVYDMNNINNVNKVTIYYTGKYNDETYYIPITKYVNDTREKITIIIDELNSVSLYTTNLMSFLNQNVKLINAIEENNNLTLEFNEAILNSDKIIPEEVIYTILYSIKDNYDVKNVAFLVKNKKILKKVLK